MHDSAFTHCSTFLTLFRFTRVSNAIDCQGNGCSSWAGACDKAACRDNSMQEGEAKRIFDECPASCGVLVHAPREKQGNWASADYNTNERFNSYLVRVDGSRVIPDGVYPGVVRKVDTQWVIRLTVANRTGVNLKAVGAQGSLRFFRRVWLDEFTLTPTEKKGRQQNHLCVMRSLVGVC
jgi:hypothetical protein